MSHLSYAARSLAQAWIYRAPNERDRCPACESRRLFDLDLIQFRRRGSGFVTGCAQCGLVFTNPPPSQDELTQFYSPSGEWRATQTHTDAPARRKKAPGRGRWMRQFDVIRDELCVAAPPRGARVFDYGCGLGKDLDALQECGWETWGLETASDDAFTRHRRVHVVPDEPMFDLVIVNHVLEHVTNPLALLRQLGRACRVGGFLLVGVPRLDTLPIHRDYKYVINGRAHVTAYTRGCLLGLLARSGFEPVGQSGAAGTNGAEGAMVSRIRLLAKKVEGAVAIPPSPAGEARRAFRAYHKGIEDRPLLARLGLLRVVARRNARLMNADAGRS